MSMSRREVLIGAAAVGAAVSLPAVAGGTAWTTPPMPAWSVGTPGEWDWQVIKAATEHEAKIAWLSDMHSIEPCEKCAGHPVEGCECEAAEYMSGIDADRRPEWDGKTVVAGDATWFSAGLGAYCGRCGSEAFRDDGGRAVKAEVVCEDCMTIEDWDVVNPERAAEMRAELADDE